MEVLVGERVFSDLEIYKLIFVDHRSCVFDLVRYDKVCRFKFQNGGYLIDRLYEAFRDSIASNNDCKYYYRRLIFDVLTNSYSHTKKFDEIIDNLNRLLWRENPNNKDCITCLINSLSVYKSCVEGNVMTKSQKRAIIKSFDVNGGFSREIERVSSLPYPLINVPKISDNIITIDSKISFNHDSILYEDAFSIRKNSEGYLLSVFISDVASYVMSYPKLWEHALQRCETIYFKTEKYHVHMFPETIRKFCSLNSGKRRYAIGYHFQLSDNFDIKRYCIRPVKIKVSKNYTFNRVDEIIHGKVKDLNYDMICLLIKAVEKFESQFNLHYHSVKEKIPIREDLDTDAAHIIEILSLFFNSYIAQIMNENGYPFIYRANNSDLTEGLIDSSFLSASPLGHIVTNGECYGQLTKPARKCECLYNQSSVTTLLTSAKYHKHHMDKDEFVEQEKYRLPLIVKELNETAFRDSECRNVLNTICAVNNGESKSKILTR